LEFDLLELHQGVRQLGQGSTLRPGPAYGQAKQGAKILARNAAEHGRFQTKHVNTE
jgi:hypothetical protein